ncbi:M20 family metallopeptidase [Planctomycetota bacterium]
MAQSQSPVDIAQKLLSFNTMQPEGNEKGCAQYLSSILEEKGFQTARYEFKKNRTTLVAEISCDSDKPPVCFTGHMDTVPLGDTPWEHAPFGGEVEGDKIYGRGITDMKGGIAAITAAAIQASENTKKMKAGLKLIFTAGEELGCKGSLHLAGMPEALGKAGALVVAEPTLNHPVCCHRGAFWIEVSAKGVTAHGATPHLGDNAIFKIVKMINKIQEYTFDIPKHPLLGPPSLNVGMIKGGENINSVPDYASFTIDIRTLPGQQHEELLEDLKKVLGEEAEISIKNDLPSVATDPDHLWMKSVRNAAENILKMDLPPEGKQAFTDASVLTEAFNCPSVILGPGTPEMCHKTDEYCLVSKIEEAVHIYTGIIENWCLE